MENDNADRRARVLESKIEYLIYMILTQEV
jgi:hypothetical protein